MSREELTQGERHWQAIRCEKRIQKRLAELDVKAMDIADRFQAMADAARGRSRCHVNQGEGLHRTFRIFPQGQCVENSTICPTEEEVAQVIEERNRLESDLGHAKSIQAELMEQAEREASSDV